MTTALIWTAVIFFAAFINTVGLDWFDRATFKLFIWYYDWVSRNMDKMLREERKRWETNFLNKNGAA